MKKTLVILSTVLLMGCQSIAEWPEFPSAEVSLMKKCSELVMLKDGEVVTITEMMNSVVQNYTTYHQCSGKVEDWQTWYEKQREAYQTAKKKSKTSLFDWSSK